MKRDYKDTLDDAKEQEHDKRVNRQSKRRKYEELEQENIFQGVNLKNIQRVGKPKQTDLKAFVAQDRYSPPQRLDDEDGHYCFVLGENISTRFKILSQIGEGTFGKVLECWDRKYKDHVAVKIIRSEEKYRDAAMIELKVLNTLQTNDEQENWHCIRLREWFDYRGHVCMVFQRLGLSLFDFIKRNGYRPFSVPLVKAFAHQLIESVAYMHELQLIHTDLKPENILLVSKEYYKEDHGPQCRLGSRIPTFPDIRVIDFGSATFDDEYHSNIVSTRHYRAPEIILGLGWSYPCDMWSVGCILLELLTGEALFQTHENLEHLAMMEQVLGQIPESMVRQVPKAIQSKYFSRSRLIFPTGADRRSIKAVRRLGTLKQMLLQDMGDKRMRPYVDDLADVIEKMLTYEPSERITAHEALQHKFFRKTMRNEPIWHTKLRKMKEAKEQLERSQSGQCKVQEAQAGECEAEETQVKVDVAEKNDTKGEGLADEVDQACDKTSDENDDKGDGDDTQESKEANSDAKPQTNDKADEAEKGKTKTAAKGEKSDQKGSEAAVETEIANGIATECIQTAGTDTSVCDKNNNKQERIGKGPNIVQRKSVSASQVQESGNHTMMVTRQRARRTQAV